MAILNNQQLSQSINDFVIPNCTKCGKTNIIIATDCDLFVCEKCYNENDR